jgi:hypothetical protein
MADHHLATYLNDHVAGSVVALELLDHLRRTHAGTEVGRFAAALHADILADRQELEALMARLQIPVSGVRRVTAWIAEKLTQVKLMLDDAAAGPLRLLEIHEGVAIGIEGKRALWTALAAAAEDKPELRGTDYARLEQRAAEQRARVEPHRLQAARAALGGKGA